MPNHDQPIDMAAESSPHFTLPGEADAAPAWEEVSAGRYMPRRVRGSCVGRALG
ncbi:MAG: hypothetical protein J5I93_21780 [Pirellulaceae bacterium]|nr:hypothetical protein [Pirellulaceae bacterium]